MVMRRVRKIIMNRLIRYSILLLTIAFHTNAYSVSWNPMDNTGWDTWIADNQTVAWCGINCVAFTNNDDIMWMEKSSVQAGGNQNLGNGDDIIGLFTAWIPDANITLNINGDAGSDLVYVNKNRANYDLDNFVVNVGLISTQITASTGNRGKVVINNIEALCFLDGCYGSVSVMPSPAPTPVPVPAGIYLFFSGLVGLGLIRAKRT